MPIEIDEVVLQIHQFLHVLQALLEVERESRFLLRWIASQQVEYGDGSLSVMTHQAGVVSL